MQKYITFHIIGILYTFQNNVVITWKDDKTPKDPLRKSKTTSQTFIYLYL